MISKKRHINLKLFSIIILFIFTAKFSYSQNTFELTKVEFFGNSSFSSSTLADVIVSKESPGWISQFINSFTSFGKGASYFDSLNIRFDLLSLNEFYVSNGYFNSKFSAEYSADTAKKIISLKFYIEENQRALINKLNIFGLEVVPQLLNQSLFKSLTIDTTQYYSENNVKQNIDRIVVTLQNNGYMQARFDSTIIYRDTVKHNANVNIYFSVGASYQISSVLIEKSGEGADKVDEQMLREIVGFEENETYNLEKIRQSQVRLYRTGLFTSVILSPKLADTLQGKVPLIMTGLIGKMNELSPEIIMNNEQGTFNLGLGTNYIRKNFLGAARKLTSGGSFGIQDFFRIDFSNLSRKFSLQDTTLMGYWEGRIKIEEPYVFNQPIFGIFETYINVEKNNIGSIRRIGGKLSFEFELPSHTFVNYLSTYYNLEAVDFTLRFTEGAAKLRLNSTLSVLGADIRSLKTDSPLFPTSGYNLFLNLEEANLIPYLINRLSNKIIGSPAFYRALITFTNYHSLSQARNAIFAFKIKTGYTQSYVGSDLDIPSNRKFFAGGSTSVRGWQPRQLTRVQVVSAGQVPQDLIQSLSANAFVLGGGTFLLEGSMEYRYRFKNDFGTALFVDWGNVWSGYKDLRFNEVAVATGFGFRYYTSFAPFRIDFGFKTFDPENRIPFFKRKFFDIMEFHFGIGEAF